MSHPARSQTQGPGKTAPARLQNLRQVPHRNRATRTRFQLLYLLHALEDTKLFLQFRSDFKDARRDVTTKRAGSGTLPTRMHDARSSPAINASLLVHPQRSCAADLGVHRCHDRCVYPHRQGHTHGEAEQLAMLWQSPKHSWSPSQQAALPLRPLPSPCLIPEGPWEVPQCPGLSAALRDAQTGQPPSGLLPALPACRLVHATLLSGARLAARCLQGSQGKHGHPSDGHGSLESKCILE